MEEGTLGRLARQGAAERARGACLAGRGGAGERHTHKWPVGGPPSGPGPRLTMAPVQCRTAQRLPSVFSKLQRPRHTRPLLLSVQTNAPLRFRPPRIHAGVWGSSRAPPRAPPLAEFPPSCLPTRRATCTPTGSIPPHHVCCTTHSTPHHPHHREAIATAVLPPPTLFTTPSAPQRVCPSGTLSPSHRGGFAVATAIDPRAKARKRLDRV